MHRYQKKYQPLGRRNLQLFLFLMQTHSTYPRRLPIFVKTQSCWRSTYWTPRRASRSGVAAPDAVMPWCVRACKRTARPSPKRAQSNRVFVIRADKAGGSQRVLRLRMHRTSAHRKRYSTRVRVYHSLRAPAPHAGRRHAACLAYRARANCRNGRNTTFLILTKNRNAPKAQISIFLKTTLPPKVLFLIF